MVKLVSKNKNSQQGKIKGSLADYLLKILEKEAVKFFIKKVLGAASMGGIKLWLIKFVIGEVFEEIDERLLEPSMRKIGTAIEKYKGKKVFKRIDNETGDDWIDAAGDM